LIIIANAISIFLQCVASGGHEFDIVKYRPPRFVLTLFNYTKGGKILYTNVIIYMIFVSITLPVIQYFKMKTVKNDYFQDVNITNLINSIYIMIFFFNFKIIILFYFFFYCLSNILANEFYSIFL